MKYIRIFIICLFLFIGNFAFAGDIANGEYGDKYVTENISSKVFSDLNYSDFIADNYDCILKGNTNIKKQILGYDSGGLPIYEFDYCPQNYKRTILLSAGMNANELSPIFALSRFLNVIVSFSYLTSNKALILNEEEISTKSALQYLHDNVRIKVIPILCPSSFDSVHKRYANFNGVNINRNFDYNGSWENMKSKRGDWWSYKGGNPLSEVESKTLEKWISENSNTDIYIDCHSDVGSDSQSTFYTFSSDFKTKAKILEAQSIIKKYYESIGCHPSKEMVRVIQSGDEYPKIPLFLEKYGISSIMIEQNPGDLTHGGSKLHNDKCDIDNYLLMITLYSYYGVSDPNYLFLVREYKKYVIFLGLVVIICLAGFVLIKYAKHNKKLIYDLYDHKI